MISSSITTLFPAPQDAPALPAHGWAGRHKPCPLLHWQQHCGGSIPRVQHSQIHQASPAHYQRALCPSWCTHSWWEDRRVTFLLCLPTFAPEKPANLWCVLCFKIITPELSGMVQAGTASWRAGARAALLDWQHRSWGCLALGYEFSSLCSKIVLPFQWSRRDFRVCGSRSTRCDGVLSGPSTASGGRPVY